MKRALFFLICLAAMRAGAAQSSAITVSAAGGGVYFLEGQSLQDVAGLEVDLSYDAAVLSTPRITQGDFLNGALMMTNTGSPGAVRIAAVRQSPLHGSGLIATLLFSTANGKEGSAGIIRLSARAISPAGTTQALQTAIRDVPVSPASDAAAPASADEAAVPSAIIAGVPFSARVPESLEQSEQDTAAAGSADTGTMHDAGEEGYAPAQHDEGPVPEDGGRRVDERDRQRILSQQSALERFRDFRGPWTISAMTGLLREEPLLGCRQEPQAVVADGRSTIVLTVLVSPESKGTPDFSVPGGAILSAEKDSGNTNTWIVRARPRRNADYAYVRIDDGIVVREVPLTVAPFRNVDLDHSGRVTERDFQIYLRDRKRRNGKEHRRDFVEEYRFAVNYAASEGKAPGHQESGSKEMLAGPPARLVGNPKPVTADEDRMTGPVRTATRSGAGNRLRR